MLRRFLYLLLPGPEAEFFKPQFKNKGPHFVGVASILLIVGQTFCRVPQGQMHILFGHYGRTRSLRGPEYNKVTC